jgi:16S rRNA (uracil1498-N3)-methyltransferase
VTARRVHLPPERIDEEGRGHLTAEARHYLAEVLRLAPGDELEVFDGRGGRYRGRLEAGLRTVQLGPREETAAPGAEIALLFALSKGEKTELVVQKATELGAVRIVPFAAERSVLRLDRAKGEERARRWRKIAEEAARQCGRADVPDVPAPLPLAEALASLAPATETVVFHPGGAPLSALRLAGGGPLAAVVGPEGGLVEAEVSACERVGARRASLGPRILRAETAAIVAVTLLQARFGDLS